MAKATSKSAPTWVALKGVLIALEAIPDESPEGARRLVIEGCADEKIRWRCGEPSDPPASSWWRTHPSNFVFSHSDVTNRAAAFMPDWPPAKLEKVHLAWEDVAALRPEIGPPPETALRSPPPPPKVEVVGTVKKRITAKDFVYESVVNGRYPRRADETEDVDYAKRLLRYAPKDWAAETITNEFARLRKDMPDLKF